MEVILWVTANDFMIEIYFSTRRCPLTTVQISLRDQAMHYNKDSVTSIERQTCLCDGILLISLKTQNQKEKVVQI